MNDDARVEATLSRIRDHPHYDPKDFAENVERYLRIVDDFRTPLTDVYDKLSRGSVFEDVVVEAHVVSRVRDDGVSAKHNKVRETAVIVNVLRRYVADVRRNVVERESNERMNSLLEKTTEHLRAWEAAWKKFKDLNEKNET